MNTKLRFLAVLILVAMIGLVPHAAQPAPNSSEIVIVYLKNQNQANIAYAVQEEYRPRLDQLAQEVKALDPVAAAQSGRPILATRDAEVAYIQQAQPEALLQSNLVARQQAVLALETAQREMRQEILARSAAERQASQRAVTQQVESLGGQVIYSYETVNALAVAISPEGRAVLADHPQVESIIDNQLTESHMDVSSVTTGAPLWWSQGFTGGAWDVAIIDSGVDNGHAALAPQFFVEKRCLSAADSLVTGMPGMDPTADDLNGHGTHVAGTVASTDGTYPGIAYGLDLLINGKAGFDRDGLDGGSASMYYADGMACADWSLNNGTDDADVINLSYGSYTTSDDGAYERFWDAVVDQMYAFVAVSAGNDGPSSYTVSSPGNAYNIMSVANVDDYNTTDRSDDSIAPSSSRGPTAAGRKKPDLSAPGSNILSTNNNWETTSDFVSYTGTSMAAPHVAGAAALILDRGVWDPMAIKALLINSAQDRGPTGWDDAYGWGYIDLAHLDYHYTNYFMDELMPSPSYDLYAGPAFIGDNATLAWHRRAIYNQTYPSVYYSLADLDLLAFDESNNSWLASSASGADNVEQVKFDADASSAVIKVDAWSTSFSGAYRELYALATEEGFTPRRGPYPQLIVSSLGNIKGATGTNIYIEATVTNSGDLRAHNTILSLEFSDGLTFISGPAAPIAIGSLNVGQSTSTYNWQFQKTNNQPQYIRLETDSDSYDEHFSHGWQLGGGLVYLPIVRK
jgi:serine protease AprX